MMQNISKVKHIKDKIRTLYNDINQNRLIALDDLICLFSDHEFSDHEFLVINYTGPKKLILPSFSFHIKYINNQFSNKTFYYLKEIYEFLEMKEKNISDYFPEQLKHISYLINKLEKNSLRIEIDDENQLLLIHFFGYFKNEDINRLIFSVKKSSLNLVNRSYEYTLENLLDLQKNYSNSIKETVYHFSKFFSDNYNLNHIIFNKNNNNEWISDDSKSSPTIINKIYENIYIIEFGKPIYYKIDSFYCLILPFLNDQKTIYFNHLIVFYSNNRIQRYVVTNFYKFINNYVNNYLEKEKRHFIIDIQKEIIDFQESEFFYSKFIPEKYLKDFSKKSFSGALRLSNAFSGTLRLYNPITQSLDIFAEETEDDDVTRNKNIESHLIKSISLENKESINVQTFKRKSKHDYSYIENMEEKQKPNSTISPLSYRNNSRSELCFPFFFKNIKIGVVNFESPMIDGFDKDDIKFLDEIKNLIEHYLIQLYTLNDKLWLSNRSQIYQNYHEIDNIIREDTFPNNYRNILQSLIKKQHISLEDEYDSLDRLNIFKEEYFNEYKLEAPHSTYENFHKRVVIRINEIYNGCEFKKHIIDSLVIIFKNLLSNQRKYSDKERDFLSINISSKTISFNIISSTPIEEELINKYLNMPYETSERYESSEISRRAHYGLFIVGMLSRQLGGYSYIKYIESKSITNIIVRIPIIEKWKKNQIP